jgi:hypothetical protein
MSTNQVTEKLIIMISMYYQINETMSYITILYQDIRISPN